GVTVTSLTVNSPTSATAMLNIDTSATPGGRTITAATKGEVVTLVDGFTVEPGTPSITQISPNQGQQGVQNLAVSLTGQATHWIQGSTTVSFGPGISVAAFTINSPTSAIATLSIDPAAIIGTRDVVVTTNAEILKLVNGFTIRAGTPVL